ncbi:MAG TPA: electron transporter RnfC [Desulfobulbaceae bacterium]|nr:electron transporter RnfC [Desulfobulbaceae bacterium]
MPAVAKAPLEVGVGLRVDQITSINQKKENFGVVASLMLEWKEPQLATRPDEDVPPQRIYKASDFVNMLTERKLLWPAHSFYNLQGRVDYQNQFVAVDSQGNVKYFARFSAAFQAPDFDFTHFPLDTQNFHIKLIALLPTSDIKFKAMTDSSGLSEELGEEEWILAHTGSKITTHTSFGITVPCFILSFQGKRHLNYYIVRILVPVIIIILVSWFTFFLKDYGKRIDLSSGNLLLFIAFNFTIANDLPRLGYITLMDTFMMATFGITGLVVLANVWLRRAQRHGREAFIDRMDDIGVWAYPLLYIGGGFLVFLMSYL